MTVTQPFLYEGQSIDASQRSFGTPGGSLHSSGFDAQSIKAGVDGEKRVGEVLDRFAREHDNVRVFHSVKLPGHFGDFDHVILIGGSAIVIDTKNWKSSATYRVAGDGQTILRDGQGFEGGKVSVARYADDLQRFLGISCSSILVVANSRSKTPGTTAQGWSFENLETLKDELARRIKMMGRTPADPRLVQMLAERVVNPGYSGSWEHIVSSERLAGGTAYQGAPRTPADFRKPERAGGTSIWRWLHLIAFPALLVGLVLSVIGKIAGTGFLLAPGWMGVLMVLAGGFFLAKTTDDAHPKGLGLVILGIITAILSFFLHAYA